MTITAKFGTGSAWVAPATGDRFSDADFLLKYFRFRIRMPLPLYGPVAQLVRAGDSSRKTVRLRRKAQSERDEFRETLTARLMAILSQAGGTPPEGAETTWELECS